MLAASPLSLWVLYPQSPVQVNQHYCQTNINYTVTVLRQKQKEGRQRTRKAEGDDYPSTNSTHPIQDL